MVQSASDNDFSVGMTSMRRIGLNFQAQSDKGILHSKIAQFRNSDAGYDKTTYINSREFFALCKKKY